MTARGGLARVFGLALALGTLCSAFSDAPARADSNFQTSVPSAILLDYDTGTILYEKDADRHFAPGTLAKVMTADVVFDALRAGKITMDTEFFVSPDAWRRGGGPSGTAAMFADVNKPVSVRNLLSGALVVSGNDAAITLAEGVGGSESGFAGLMNAQAKTIGMTNSVFRNATGFEDAAQVSTARDLALLGQHVIHTYPDYYPIFSEPSIKWNKIFQRNRDVLLGANIGADGLQVGWIKDGGYHALASAVQKDQRLVAVTLGAKSEKERLDETKRLLDWGFESFRPRRLFSAGKEIARARVFGGDRSSVGLTAHGPVLVLASRASGERVTAKVSYTGPLRAPVVKDTQVGELTVFRGQVGVLTVPLYTMADVPEGSLGRRAGDGLLTLMGDAIRDVAVKAVSRLQR